MHEEMMQRLEKSGEGGNEDEAEDDEDGDDDEEEEWKGLSEKQLCPESERITMESFAAWKQTFEEEMIACGVIKREENRAKTGKQIFLDTKKDVEENKEVKKDDKGVLVYDATLFGEDGLDDLDDLSGED